MTTKSVWSHGTVDSGRWTAVDRDSEFLGQAKNKKTRGTAGTVGRLGLNGVCATLRQKRCFFGVV